MYALCIESSHARGMGHLFRMLNLARELEAAGRPCKFYLNDHAPSRRLLEERGYRYEEVQLDDDMSDWEGMLIDKDGIALWIDDRLDTSLEHAGRVKARGIPLVTFDNRGQGAALADLHIAALCFDATERLDGKRVLRGQGYLILDPRIRDHARLRTTLSSILVTLGGSDTHGVTVKVVQLLKETGWGATIVLGPAFQHEQALSEVLTADFVVKRGVPSMIEEFVRHDLAITGGGITPFEANASGLPCVVIANETFEIPVGIALEELGGAVFAGFHESLRTPLFKADLPLPRMSRAGLDNIGLQGTRRVIEAMAELDR